MLQEELDDYDGKNRRGKVAIVHILFRVKGDSDLVVSAKAFIVQSLYNTINRVNLYAVDSAGCFAISYLLE